jgi:hypothetical protein
MGANQRTSSGLKNMNLTAAERRLTLMGYPVRMTRLRTMRPASPPIELPEATSVRRK